MGDAANAAASVMFANSVKVSAVVHKPRQRLLRRERGTETSINSTSSSVTLWRLAVCKIAQCRLDAVCSHKSFSFPVEKAGDNPTFSILGRLAFSVA